MATYTVGMSMWVQRITEVQVDARNKAEARKKALCSHEDQWEIGDARPVTVTYVLPALASKDAAE